MSDSTPDTSLHVSDAGMVQHLAARLEDAQSEIARLQADAGVREEGEGVVSGVAAAQLARAEELAVLLEAERAAHAATASSLVNAETRVAAAEARAAAAKAHLDERIQSDAIVRARVPKDESGRPQSWTDRDSVRLLKARLQLQQLEAEAAVDWRDNTIIALEPLARGEDNENHDLVEAIFDRAEENVERHARIEELRTRVAQELADKELRRRESAPEIADGDESGAKAAAP